MSDLTDFDRITSAIPMLSPFQVLWNEAEESLCALHPEGFNVEEIGRMAFEALPEAEKATAMGELFYTFWVATLADRETRAMRDGGAA